MILRLMFQEYKEKLRRGGHNIARKLEEDLSKAKERHHPTSADYKAKYKSLTRKLEATRKMYLDSTDLDNTQAKLDHVRREVRLREKRSQKLKLRIQQLESELVNYKDKSQELKEENRALNTRISELEEEVSAATISLDEKESYIKNLQHRCEEDYDGDEAGRRSSEISTSGTECFNRLSMQSETFRHSLQSDDTAIIPESSDEVDASSKPKSQLKVGIDTQISKSRIAVFPSMSTEGSNKIVTYIENGHERFVANIVFRLRALRDLRQLCTKFEEISVGERKHLLTPRRNYTMPRPPRSRSASRSPASHGRTKRKIKRSASSGIQCTYSWAHILVERLRGIVDPYILHSFFDASMHWLVETKAIDLECWTKLIPPFRCLIASHYIPRSPRYRIVETSMPLVEKDIKGNHIAVGIRGLQHVANKFPEMLEEFSERLSSTDLDPNHLTCYLCGRKYGTKSLAIHLPQCKELWIRRQSRKPLKERKALPECPDGWKIWMKGQPIEELQKYNILAMFSEE